jgi:hypothetical protein
MENLLFGHAGVDRAILACADDEGQRAGMVASPPLVVRAPLSLDRLRWTLGV